jgi:hypothetical protein
LEFRAIDGRQIYTPVYLRVTLLNPSEIPQYEKIVTIKENVQKTINIAKVEPYFKDLLEQPNFADPPLQYEDAFIEYSQFLTELKT